MVIEFRTVKVPIDAIEWEEVRVPSNLEAQERLILKQSIKEIGLLHPIIACRDKEGRIIGVAGYNRWLALRANGVTEVEVRLYEPCDEGTNLLIQIAENAGRGRVSDYDMLVAIAKLNQGKKLPLSKLSEITGLSVSTLSKLIRVYQKSLPIVHEYMKAGKLTVWHALELLRLPDARSQYEYATMAADYGWSVRELRETITRYLDSLRIEEEEEEQADTALTQPVTTTLEDIHELETEDLTQTTPETPQNEEQETRKEEQPTQPQQQQALEEHQAIQEEQEEEQETPQQPPITCPLCGKPITGTPITVQTHKQCLITATIALKQLANILAKQPNKLTPQDALMINELAELAMKHIQEHPEQYQ